MLEKCTRLAEPEMPPVPHEEEEEGDEGGDTTTNEEGTSADAAAAGGEEGEDGEKDGPLWELTKVSSMYAYLVQYLSFPIQS